MIPVIRGTLRSDVWSRGIDVKKLNKTDVNLKRLRIITTGYPENHYLQIIGFSQTQSLNYFFYFFQ